MNPPYASFHQRIRSGPLAADGALGALLLARRAPFRGCLEELNLSSPHEIRGIHEEYVRAGAEIIQTNTFGANRARLAEYGLAKAVEGINRAGVKVAREAAGGEVLVAGAVGPLGRPLAGAAKGGETEVAGKAITPREARRLFREQARVLADAGVDMILFETFLDADELAEALSAARGLTGGRIPLVAQVSVNGAGRMANGYSLGEVARRLTRLGADAIGCNCSEGPPSVLSAIEVMAANSGRPVSAQPSAGLPRRPVENAQLVAGTHSLYPYTPRDFGEWAQRLIEAGAVIVGGCCGTTPDHIRPVRAAVERARGRCVALPGSPARVLEEAPASRVRRSSSHPH